VVGNRRLSTLSNHTSPWEAREDQIERIARRQHDQLTLAQLRAAGLSEGGIRHRVRTGRLRRAHRGVYSLGHPPTSALEHRMAAVLACGSNAALSHAAAAANLGIRPSAATLIDVTCPSGTGRLQAGLRVHRAALSPEEITLVNGIPTTTCARTLLDLAEVVNREALAKAIDQAEIEGVFDLAELNDTMATNPGRRGLLPLRACLSSIDPQSKLTRSDFEHRFLSLMKEAGIPPPEVNAILTLEGQTLEVDFLWRHERLVVEADGWETHRTRRAFVRDRRRDQLLVRAQYRPIRITWHDEPDLVIATIRAAL
jgi:hypothetical protein